MARDAAELLKAGREASRRGELVVILFPSQVPMAVATDSPYLLYERMQPMPKASDSGREAEIERWAKEIDEGGAVAD